MSNGARYMGAWFRPAIDYPTELVDNLPGPPCSACAHAERVHARYLIGSLAAWLYFLRDLAGE